jgi:hypothetical protein
MLLKSKSLAAAAVLGLATVVPLTGIANAAKVGNPNAAFGIAGANAATDVQYRRGGWRGGHRHGGWRGGRGRHYHGGRGAGLGIGLATGAIIGGIIGAQQAPMYAGDAESYCMSRFKSYDPQSGTYLGYDGLRHPCP